LISLAFCKAAERDIEAIGDFIARDNPVRAVSCIAALRAKCQLLALLPRSAPLRPAFGEGVRMSIFGR
jgi:plasmid stabilization system protein ParE